MIKITEFIRFLARQGLAFRGNNGNDNLTQLFKNDPALLTRLHKEGHLESGQHMYIHKDIQNQLIGLMARQVLAKKLGSIRSSKFFGIMAADYTDISNKKLLSMCFLWIEDLRVLEDFVGCCEKMRPIRKYNQMKKLSYFSKPSQRKFLIILSATRLHYRVKEKGQTIDLSITSFKLKDITIMQTNIIPLLWKNTSGNNILKTSTLSYHQLKIVSINLLSRHSSKWSKSC